MIVCYPSTPAQLFHLLRRQMMLPFRRPLVVFTPKSLLRHPDCVSTLHELADGGFREIVPDSADPSGVRTLLLCSGKIFFELAAQRAEKGLSDVAIIRIEQLYPLGSELLKAELDRYSTVAELRWVQEEPENNGAWPYIRSLIAELAGRTPRYVGRQAAAAPAVGSHRIHGIEQQRILDEAFRR